MARFAPKVGFDRVLVSLDSGDIEIDADGFETEDLAQISALNNISTVKRLGSDEKPAAPVKSRGKSPFKEQPEDINYPNQEDE